MRLLNSLLFSSLLIGQTYNLPFDWSGQFGISTVEGRLFWNSDWTSGPLLFDGTYAHYPLRYGNTISALFQPAGTHLIPLTKCQLPDTAITTTTLDYERGDYNYDLLAIDADFKTPGRSVGLHGFKRSYAGREGQFFHPKGNTSPLQQTYKVDYRSENKGWLIDASRKRKDNKMSDKIFNEIYDAYQNKGSAIKKKEDTHRMAESNKAFAHFRW